MHAGCCVRPADRSAYACGSLRQDIGSSQVEGKKVVGVDAEWELGAAGRKTVATIQVAPLRGTPFVFHLQRGQSGFTKETFPETLKLLLEYSSIVKVRVTKTGFFLRHHIGTMYGLVRDERLADRVVLLNIVVPEAHISPHEARRKTFGGQDTSMAR